ncbi:amino-acid N-acetyltransferase [Endozoicomonas sp. SM1973]|uniref:Amino-acid acetyltransferase n=1 Tax=Spartinivicinus marinus TaxID=2994442 RepID=A0A853IDS2_9GAMM|nr:amino-acid N-acetyltransferase [Spartinivicinus marinus]MCX4026164.1 amino-acid N-acetyltransferase [Spartinivicinus marinus]NYZ68698.1 amino-acid N-acetyltransferase [Spartinivicinus marinus]
MVDFSSPEYVSFFRHSSPYINAHRGRTFVLMIGGEAIADNNFGNIIHDIALLNSLGVRLVVVFGARPQIDQYLKERQVACKFHQHQRITDKEVLESVKDAVGNLRIKIESMLSMGLANSPMYNARIRVIGGNFVTAKPIGVVDGVDFLHSGDVRRIDRKAISQQLDDGYVVLLSCLGSSPTGQVFNLATEDVATQAAISLGAEKLIIFGSKSGIQDNNNQLIRSMKPAEALRILKQSTSLETKRLLSAALTACEGGTDRAHIISHQQDGALLQELFTRDGSGTLITHDGYEEIRQGNIEDVGGIIKLIQPLEKQGVLVRRSRKQIEQEINLFTIIERDGTIIGCAAFHPYPDSDSAELACVAVHQDYRGNDRGNLLLQHNEEAARKQGIKALFVLTTKTAHWFLERGFEETTLDELPNAKKNTYNPKRGSKVFVKKL